MTTSRFISKLIKCSSNYIPKNILPKNLNEEDFELVIDEIVNDEDSGKSDTEIETYESTEDSKFPQEYDDGGVIILMDLNEKECMIHEYKQFSKDENLMFYLFS